MPRLLKTIVVLSLSTALFAQDGKVPAPAGGTGGNVAPKVTCPQPNFDFGEAPQFDKVEHAFEIYNQGNAELRISQVVPSCQCTAGMPDKTVLGPGEKTLIKATMNTQTFQGAVTKSLEVVSNDPVTPRLHLTITGKIQAPFRPAITEVNFGAAVKRTPIPAKSFEIFTGSNGTSHLIDVKSDCPQIKATLDPLPPSNPQKGYMVKVSVDGDLPVGQMVATLTFNTDVAAQRTVTIPVRALIEGEVSVKPKTFNFGKVKRGEAADKVVEIAKSGAADLKIDSLQIKPEGAFTAKLVAVEEGRSYKIILAPAADAKDGYARGTLTINTNCPGENSLQVFFYAFVQQ